MSIDTEQLLADLSPEHPSGEDLSYDASYVALMTDAEGVPERQVGDSVIPAEDPDWRKIKSGCIELLGKGRELRLILQLSVALLETEGIQGFASGLTLLRGAIERHWDSVHPQLDPDDDNDPLERVNIISVLAAAAHTDGDSMRVHERLRAAPLCESRQLGRFGLRDIMIASGELSAPEGDDQPPSTSVIEGAFADTDLEMLQANMAAAETCVQESQALDRILTEKVGAGAAPDLSAFHAAIKQVHKALEEALARRGYGSDDAGETQDEHSADSAAQKAAPTVRPAGVGEIASTSDVLKAFDKICEFYAKSEPSSPVPLVVKRAKRLVGKSFMDIMNDLSPGSVDEIQKVSGKEPGEE
ncbi:MAG: type VI secretion system protein TssA [Planctomycetota bacterium]